MGFTVALSQADVFIENHGWTRVREPEAPALWSSQKIPCRFAPLHLRLRPSRLFCSALHHTSLHSGPRSWHPSWLSRRPSPLITRI